MKFKLELDTDIIKGKLKRWRCLFKHDWTINQETFAIVDYKDGGYKNGPVIAWRYCERCGKNNIIHVL